MQFIVGHASNFVWSLTGQQKQLEHWCEWSRCIRWNAYCFRRCPKIANFIMCEFAITFVAAAGTSDTATGIDPDPPLPFQPAHQRRESDEETAGSYFAQTFLAHSE